MKFIFEHSCIGVLIPMMLVLLPASIINAQDQKPEQPEAPQPKPVEVDKDQKTPILIYDTSGGERIAPVEKKVPKFQLFADGRVIAGGNPGTRLINGKLSETELAALLDLVVNENDFFGLVQKDVEAKMGESKFTFFDAPNTKFSVDIKDRKNTISIHAMFNVIRTHPNLDEIKRLTNIERELVHISAKIHMGEDANEVLDFANEGLKKKEQNKEQKTAPLKLEEVAMASRGLNGRFQVRFTRGDLHVIYVRKKGEEKPHLSIFGLDK